MTRTGDKTFWNSDEAAVAPTFVVASFALVAVMGISFDYARLAVLDSELQAAADQAALAAATQLDGSTNARTHAGYAADNLVQNKTIFANDGGSRTLTVASKTYYDSYDSATDTYGAVSTTDAGATVVEITLTARKAFYALTPIVRLFNSGNLTAKAVAGLQSSVCRAPPLMMCNPNESAGGSFPAADGSDRGKGILLVEGPNGTQWGPGNFGYLDYGAGAKALQDALGANTNSDNCAPPSTLKTKPGATANAPAGLNTRFDIYDMTGNSSICSLSAGGAGTCSPSMNTRKDVIHSSNFNANANCQSGSGGNQWNLPSKPYVGVSGTSATISAMGFPRDTCHYSSVTGGAACTNGRIGDKVWDYGTYFNINHASDGMTLAAVQSWAGRASASEVSRYDVYRYELTNSAYTADISANAPDGGSKMYSGPKCGTGQAETATIKDRRVLKVAVVNCTANGINGSVALKDVSGWADLFLVEPSLDRSITTGSPPNKVTTKYTNNTDIYAEVIGVGTKPQGGNAFQYYLRREPRLLK